MEEMRLTDERLNVLEHPLIAHKMSIMRDASTAPSQFRQLVHEVAMLEVYEASRDLPTESVEVDTPLQRTVGKRIAGENLAVVPILRAGMGMLDGVLSAIPSAAVGVLGMERDEQTHQPHEYYAKMPKGIADRTVFLIDPMLATGGSALSAIHYLREQGVRDIRFLVLVAAPEGVRAVLQEDPNVRIWTCALDDGLNDQAYILPGLGDAGDRIFGTL